MELKYRHKSQHFLSDIKWLQQLEFKQNHREWIVQIHEGEMQFCQREGGSKCSISL
jgi:hypothetical protein